MRWPRHSFSLWLTQLAMAELFNVTVANTNIHIRKILDEGELDAEAVVKQDLITAADGKNYRTKLYRLDMVLAVGYPRLRLGPAFSSLGCPCPFARRVA